MTFTIRRSNVVVKIFSGQLETYMNVGGVLIGADSFIQDRVCFAQVKFSQSEWYIKIGSPGQRAGIMVVVPGMKKPLFRFSTYLQIGNNIDDLPALPQDILDALKQSGVENKYANGSLILILILVALLIIWKQIEKNNFRHEYNVQTWRTILLVYHFNFKYFRYSNGRLLS